MSTILQTTTTLEVNSGNFVLKTEYSGEVNPNVTFDITFTVTDGLDALEGVNIAIGANNYLTDANGQVVVTLVRGLYVADITFSGYESDSVSFEVLDQNITENVVLNQIGSFNISYNESYD